MPATSLLELLQNVAVSFSSPLQPSLPKLPTSDSAATVVWARLSFDDNPEPAVSLRGEAAVQDQTLMWSMNRTDVDRLSSLVLERPVNVRFEVACDYVLDERGRPVSGNAAAIFNRPGPFTPGGVLRLLMAANPSAQARRSMTTARLRNASDTDVRNG